MYIAGVASGAQVKLTTVAPLSAPSVPDHLEPLFDSYHVHGMVDVIPRGRAVFLVNHSTPIVLQLCIHSNPVGNGALQDGLSHGLHIIGDYGLIFNLDGCFVDGRAACVGLRSLLRASVPEHQIVVDGPLECFVRQTPVATHVGCVTVD